MAKRSNVDRLTRPGQRNRLNERVLQRYVAAASAGLQERLKQAALRDRALDVEIAGDWSAVDQEQWQKLDEQERQATVGRKEVKSTSRRSTRR